MRHNFQSNLSLKAALRHRVGGKGPVAGHFSKLEAGLMSKALRCCANCPAGPQSQSGNWQLAVSSMNTLRQAAAALCVCTACRPFLPEILYSDTKTGKLLSAHFATLLV